MARTPNPVFAIALLLVCSACGSDSNESTTPSGAGGGRSGFLSERFADAAFQGNVKAVEEMLEFVDVDAVDEGGRTMLMLASYGGHSTTVRLLCENNADPNLKDTNRRTALMYAASGPNAHTVEILLAHGAEVNVTDGAEGYTALMFAAAEGHADIVQLLVDQGADPDLRDIDGESALKFATDNNHQDVITVLQKAARP